MNFITLGTQAFSSPERAQNICALEGDIARDKAQISCDRRESVIKRLRDRNKMTAEERVRALCDDASPWMIGEYAGFDVPAEGYHKPYRLGVITAIGVVKSRQAMIIANDNTIAAGSWWPGTPQKIVHALETARRLGIPVIYLIECAGLYLPHADLTFAGRGAAGAIFEMQAQLSRAGIRQIAAIFGDCIAGGGYMPLLCDKIVMTEQASLCIGGTAIASCAKGARDAQLGTPSTHVHLSRCVEERVPDDASAIQKLRVWLDMLPTSAVEFFRLDHPVDPPFDQGDLYQIIPEDPAEPFPIEEVLARLVDGAQVQWIDDDRGPEILAALALFDGLPAIVIANRAVQTQTATGRVCAGGILYRDGITKMRVVCENAHSNGIPVIWLQDVSGFDIGHDAETEGLLRHGAMLLRELAADGADIPPHLTVILRKASGAGYYAMKGAPFHPVLTIATAVARQAVMSPETLASALFDKKIERAGDISQKNDLIADKERMIVAQRDASSPKAAAMRGDIDDIVPLCELRMRIVQFVRAAYQCSSRPFKPVRLWGQIQ